MNRGAAVISIDTEQIWGYFDLIGERQFEARYPNARDTHHRLLELLSREGIGATWAVVGALSLAGSEGGADERMSGTPAYWAERIPAGDETSRPLWYARSFVRCIQSARTPQEIGLHGGISHLVWGDARTSPALAASELRAGIAALNEIGVDPASFVFPRDLEAHHAILADDGIRCYRGRAPILSERLGYNIAGSLARAAEEVSKATPPVVWPEQVLPGLWNLPASMFLYSLGRERSRLVKPGLRVERTQLGLRAAAKDRGVFHLGLHPENLAESDFAFAIFEQMIHEICRWRDQDDIDILTMSEAVNRVAMESKELTTA
ncbi:MAG: hypothetical protein M3O35_09420 [Acidobacteriota bacterium]|nr:hypothetical protein [Acidobacteriota bacterium]